MPQRAAGEPAGNAARERRCWARVGLLCRRFRRDAGGSTAVEFGLVSVPFIALLLAILETALTFLTTQALENAVETAARQLYTGQFQLGNANTSSAEIAAKFKEAFCKGGIKAADGKSYIVLAPCDTVKIDVQAYPNNAFPSSMPSPFSTNANGDTVINPAFGAYNNPGANQIVVIRAAIENQVFVSLLNPNQANLSNGKRLIVATAAFRTEPFN